MRKLTLSLFILALLAAPLHAQKGPVGRKVTQNLTKRTRNGGALPPRSTRSPSGGASALPRVEAAVRQTQMQTPSQQNGLAREIVVPQPGRSGAIPNAAEQAALRAQIQAQAQRNIELRRQLWNEKFNSGIGKSVLYAPVIGHEDVAFSVTVIESDGEVFGVVASHALQEDFLHREGSLPKNFRARVLLPNGTTRYIPAQVVQSAPQSMLDISLVKFEPQDEALLKPLELAANQAQETETLFAFGFGLGQPKTGEHTVHEKALVSVRTDNAIAGNHDGFCGSPMLDGTGKLKAIYTGHKDDVSYGTHATFIPKLIEAYHAQGQAQYDLVLGPHTVTRLNVDEYISAVNLFDANGKKIFEHNFRDKFSQSVVLSALEDHPQAAYLSLTSRKARWTQDNGEDVLMEDRSGRDKTKRQHWYNLQTQQIEPQRPAVIKM